MRFRPLCTNQWIHVWVSMPGTLPGCYAGIPDRQQACCSVLPVKHHGITCWHQPCSPNHSNFVCQSRWNMILCYCALCCCVNFLRTCPVFSKNHLMYGPGRPFSALKHCNVLSDNHRQQFGCCSGHAILLGAVLTIGCAHEAGILAHDWAANLLLTR